jgi:hypothetical protein
MPPAKTAVELARWQGEVSSNLKHLTDEVGRVRETLDNLPEALARHATTFAEALATHSREDREDFSKLGAKVETVAKAQATMRGKVALISAAVGALVGAVLQVAIAKAFG